MDSLDCKKGVICVLLRASYLGVSALLAYRTARGLLSQPARQPKLPLAPGWSPALKQGGWHTTDYVFDERYCPN